MQILDFSKGTVLVAGDVMLDRYWRGNTSRVSPEAPVPVVHVQHREDRAGGAANVALNIAALGGKVALLGYAGQDEAGDALKALLQHRLAHCRLLPTGSLPTLTKLRVVSRQQQLLRLDFEEPLHGLPTDEFLSAFAECLPTVDCVVLSDYDKGTLTAVAAVIELCRANQKPVLVDPKGANFDKYAGADLLTPNQAEFERVVGRCANESELTERAQSLMTRLQLGALLVTRGEHGMSLFRADQTPLHLPARAREVFDVTGAGDTVISTLAAALAAGAYLPNAVALANLAAGIVVGKLGTATVSCAELTDALLGQRAAHHGVLSLETLLAILPESRARGERIVVTNGCFDLLHRGHIDYLQAARELGDRLIVLVNDDDSVRRLKGPTRPVNRLDDRMAMLAALGCVDWVVPFDSDTPRDQICRIRPDVLVKGGDYPDITTIAGHDCVLQSGGEVRALPFVDGYSTTGLIGRLRDE